MDDEELAESMVSAVSDHAADLSADGRDVALLTASHGCVRLHLSLQVPC